MYGIKEFALAKRMHEILMHAALRHPYAFFQRLKIHFHEASPDPIPLAALFFWYIKGDNRQTAAFWHRKTDMRRRKKVGARLLIRQ